jgi:hypothetical protein
MTWTLLDPVAPVTRKRIGHHKAVRKERGSDLLIQGSVDKFSGIPRVISSLTDGRNI